MQLPVSTIAPLTLLFLMGCDAPRSTSLGNSAESPGVVQGDVREAVLPLGRFVRQGDYKCRGRDYNAFDFWVGKWNATITGAPEIVGTNVITRETDGCTVEEHWTDASGMRGRSLNAYDATTGRWYQLWMEQSGGGLQFDGISGPRSMQLAGTHQTSRNDPTPVTDRGTWTALGANSVRQLGEIAIDGGPFETAYDITYLRAAVPQAITPSATAICSAPTRPRYHAFDFILGSWTLTTPSAPVTGRSEIRTDMNGCLVEERITGPDGYKAVAYSGFRATTFVWNWMFMDNRGVQLRLSGPATLTGTNMILTGTRTDRSGATVDVRAEWIVIDETAVEQRWAFSTDSGVTWSEPIVVRMTK
jgi:hypothetical protein